MDRTNVTNIFIANLSIGDILVITFCLPFRVSIILCQINFECNTGGKNDMVYKLLLRL